MSTPSTNKKGNIQVKPRKRKTIWICVAIVVGILAVAGVVVAVLVGKNVIRVDSRANSLPEVEAASHNASSSPPSSAIDSNPDLHNGGGVEDGSETRPTMTATAAVTSATAEDTVSVFCPTKHDIPSVAKGTYLDTSSWFNLDGFNCTYTDETVGNLPIVGLNSTWDDSKRANPTVPPLNRPWGPYSRRPARGVNLGGWLSLEPFITPSLFEYAPELGIVDEWSLCKHLGSRNATIMLEQHYAAFISEEDFKSIANAGLDHVRIPFSYWAVEIYDDDPYVPHISWRYLLRGIEWARKYGLRIKLDLHGLPGSQNSWNHSGRQGKVGWLSGSNGPTNAQRSLDIHDRLSKFFAQERYKNVLAFYGLANEPARTHDMDELITWITNAYEIVRDNGVEAAQVFSDSLRGLEPWKGKLEGYGDSLVVDAHEYVIFDNALLQLNHSAKISFACETWTRQILDSINIASGFGPTMVGEWSQADTDCTKYLNGIGNGARWAGTFSDTLNVPRCPTQDDQCNCELANASPSNFTAEYRLFLKTWAQAQMHAFERSWGWFYWTWKTESAPLWSYKAGLASGIIPHRAYEREWECSDPIPSFVNPPENV